MIGAAQVKRFGVPTIIGFVSGLLFASLAIGAPPDFLFLIPATIAAGLTYDLALRGGDYAKMPLPCDASLLPRLLAAYPNPWS